MQSHTTRRGTARRTKPVTSYAALLDLPSRTAHDDGGVILHVGDWQPTCADCGRGTLTWAEGGFTPWHRICDTCGSHWDLHPLGMGIAYAPRSQAGCPIHPPSCCTCQPDAEPIPSRWIDGRGWVALDGDAAIGPEPNPHAMGDADGPGRPWRELLALVTPVMREAAEADRERTLGVPCVPACWARRARFYQS